MRCPLSALAHAPSLSLSHPEDGVTLSHRPRCACPSVNQPAAARARVNMGNYMDYALCVANVLLMCC